jgi:hypothetical protein
VDTSAINDCATTDVAPVKVPIRQIFAQTPDHPVQLFDVRGRILSGHVRMSGVLFAKTGTRITPVACPQVLHW